MISVLIPYRSDGGQRDRIFAWLLQRWHVMFPKAQLCIGEDDTEPFNRSRARNNAYAQARGDMLVVADADTCFQRSQVAQALQYIKEHPRSWVLPYEIYYNLCEEDTAVVLEQHPATEIPAPLRWEHRLTDSVAGLLIMPRDAFEEVGHYDERFPVWGHEDRAIALALDTLWSRHHRLWNQYVLHCFHPVGPNEAFNTPGIEQCWSRYQDYLGAVGDPTLMRSLVEKSDV